MSIKLLQTFAKVFNFTSPRLSCKTSVTRTLQLRHITAMSAEPIDETQLIANKKLTRFKKRQWDYSNRKNYEDGEPKRLCEGEKFERIKKKKVAMLVGYSGVDYYGMQRNPGVRTIEEDLLKALLEAKYITEEDFKNQQNTQFQRGSRTDKGVSAARQVVSMKMPLEYNIEEINKHLPPCIRVFGIKRTTNKFNSKSQCNARSYTYTLPTYVFEPTLVKLDERKSYRISAEKLTQVNNLLAEYKGTRPYHNFTEKKHYLDPSVKRFMMDFGVQKVFVEGDMEFAELLVKGQSFMLHQIRKMVGLAIAVIRGQTDKEMFDKVFRKDKLVTPTAPGLGLVLEMVHYDRYSARFEDTHGGLSWDDVDATVEAFKREHIYPVIVRGEIENNNMGLWLHEKLNYHSYEPKEDDYQRETETTIDDDDEGGELVEQKETNDVPQDVLDTSSINNEKKNCMEDSNKKSVHIEPNKGGSGSCVVSRGQGVGKGQRGKAKIPPTRA